MRSCGPLSLSKGWAGYVRHSRTSAGCRSHDGRRSPRLTLDVPFYSLPPCQAVPVLLVVGFVAYAMFAFVGDPVVIMLGQDYTEAQRQALVAQLGLDRSFLVQYANFIWAALHGDFGSSYRLARPVAGLIAERMPATIELAFSASVLALLIGVPVGVYTAIHPTSLLSQTFLAFSLIGVSLPTFLIGILLILCFSVVLGWLPSFGRGEVVHLGRWWTTGFLTVSGMKA
jgi:peptide/nickel transport system permease protein